MPFSSDPFVIRMPQKPSPSERAALGTAVLEARAAGASDIVVDLDDVTVLDSAVIATLISLLRDVRERGATMSLAATRPGILTTLSITGLDKVFAIVAPPLPRPAVSPPASKAGRARRVAAMVAVGALLGTTGASFSESIPASPSATEIVERVIARDARIASYRAHVSVAFQLRSFPYVSQHLDGTAYYKRPDNFEIVFDRVPSYAKGFDKLYADIDDPSSWRRRFALSLVGQRQIDGHTDAVIRLVQLVRGMIDHQDVAIDPDRARIDAMEWHYYNGGTIEMTQQYQKAGEFDVLSAQHATIRIPFVHAAADASYTGYETNIAVDDSVFTRGAHK